MNYRKREDLFNKTMVAIRQFLYGLLKLEVHRKFESNISNDGYVPVLSVKPEKGLYRFNCYCFDCPCNKNGLCVTKFDRLPYEIMHEFDGDNCIKNYCG